MIPILYEATETAFISNGVCRLRDCVSCVVTEERNSIYECDFEYPVTGANYEEIQLGRIIAVEHDDSSDIQPFDIVSYSRPINGVVTFHAVHISYRQSKMTVSGTNINSLVAALNLLGNASPSNPFTYDTDMVSSNYFPCADGIPRTVRSMLGGVEGSILDTYGGEFEWDKFNVMLWSARGQQLDTTIRYGVNLTGYNENSDYSESYSAVIPYWSQNGVVVKGTLADSGQETYTGRTDVVPMDLTEKFENQPTAAQLQSMASSILSSSQPYLPSQSIKVDFISLRGTNEYEELAPLLDCKLCDSIRVEFPRYGMSGRFKIVKTVYDVLLERFEEMELGTLSTTLSEALGISNEMRERVSVDEFVVKDKSFSTTANSSVSPFSAYCEVRMESEAPTGYTAVAITPVGVGSTNPILCRIFNDAGSFFAYSESAVTLTARIIYKKNV